MVGKMFRSSVKGASARLFTWEVVTGFDEELFGESLRQRFDEDFQGCFQEESPVFFKMVSFNGGNGRKHRYLVALVDKEMSLKKGNTRELPWSITLYKECDEKMRCGSWSQNLCYSKIVGDVLYILVFMEGRLCHWSEEFGYGNFDSCSDGADVLGERMERFRQFLKHDDLFSRVDSFAFECGTDEEDFYAASLDPFWRNKSLVPYVKTIRFRLAVVAMVAVVAFLFAVVGFGEMEGEYEFMGVAPELLLPEPFVSLEVRKTVELPPKETRLRHCAEPLIKLNGLVEGKVCQLRAADGSSSWLREGEFIDGFRVQSIGRDRVVLECGGSLFDVHNGV